MHEQGIAVLEVPEQLLTELKQYVMCTSVEIGGFLVGIQVAPGRYKVTKIHVSEQAVHDTEVDVAEADTDKLVKLLHNQFEDAMKETFDKLPELKEDIPFAASMYVTKEKAKEKIICQWHSHVDMPTFMSGTDEKTLVALSKQHGMMFMLIMNKEDERNLWVSCTGVVCVHKAHASLVVVDCKEVTKTLEQTITEIKKNRTIRTS